MAEAAILILGGTGLAARLAGAARDLPVRVIYSLAGRTVAAPPDGVETRIGGFGGTAALADYLRSQNVVAVVDATHAHAAEISANAGKASELAHRPLLRLEAPPWQAEAGDRWIDVADIAAARNAAAGAAARVFVSTGRQSMAEFAHDRRCWWLSRVIAPGADLPELSSGDYIYDRGPFELADELALFDQHGIDAVISKNAGGTATYPKIAAARQLGLPVFMVARPDPGAAPVVDNAEDAVAWIRRYLDPGA
jgi:precorrin-6A/cobalt-precorrin-6A reductase